MDTRPTIGTTVEVLLADARDWRRAIVIEPHPKSTAPTQARVSLVGIDVEFDVWLANMRPYTAPAAPYVRHKWVRHDDSGQHKTCDTCGMCIDRIGGELWFSLPGQPGQVATADNPVPGCDGPPDVPAPVRIPRGIEDATRKAGT